MRLTDQEKIEIVNKYKTGQYNCSSLAREYKIWPSSIRQILIRRKIPIINNQSFLQRKYHINDDFFKEINTEENAYILGFLYADGCLSKNRNAISIGLSSVDIDILEKIRTILQSNHPIVNKTVETRYGISNVSVYWIVNKFLYNDLIKLGCIPQKSLKLKFPSSNIIPLELMKHFIRGYFDGDGFISLSIRKDRNNYPNLTIGLVSTFDFCEKYKEFMITKFPDIHIGLHEESNKNNITYSATISGNLQAMEFLDWIYKDARIFLNRKYSKYLEIKEIIKNYGAINGSNQYIKKKLINGKVEII